MFTKTRSYMLFQNICRSSAVFCWPSLWPWLPSYLGADSWSRLTHPLSIVLPWHSWYRQWYRVTLDTRHMWAGGNLWIHSQRRLSNIFFFFLGGGVTLVSWVQRTQAWPSANYVRRLAFGQTGSYSVQPILLLAATIGPAGRSRVFFYWVRPASFMGGPNYTAPSCPTATVRLINNTETLVPQIHHLYHRQVLNRLCNFKIIPNLEFPYKGKHSLHVRWLVDIRLKK